MDKKLLLRPKLSVAMSHCLPLIQALVLQHENSVGILKTDGTFVTSLDLALSDLIEGVSREHYTDCSFYSEENFNVLSFPALVVDPLDGTREYLAKRPEWAISVALFESEDFHGEGWIYNPMSQDLFHSGVVKPRDTSKRSYLGEVSRSEWDEGLFKKNKFPHLSLKPMGSIAFKLGHLSRGDCDFVVSFRPKNIWDVAAGTLLAKAAGYKFYSAGKVVTKVQKLYEPPLIWCHEDLYPTLKSAFL